MTIGNTIWDAIKYIETRVKQSGFMKLHTVEVNERGYAAVSIVIDQSQCDIDWYDHAKLCEKSWLLPFPEDVSERVVVVPYPSRTFVPDYEAASAAGIERFRAENEVRIRETEEAIGRLTSLLQGTAARTEIDACAGTVDSSE